MPDIDPIDAEMADYHAYLRTKPLVRISVTDADGVLLQTAVAYKTDDNLPLTVFAGQITDLVERNFDTIEQ